MQSITTAQQKRFDIYLEELGRKVGHQDRLEPLRSYIMGLSLPCERKNIEQMAAMIEPKHVSACHQSLHHFVANSTWDDSALLQVACNHVLETMIQHGGVKSLIIDDTGVPKKGKHSVGVAKQYCGKLGKRENCQNVVTVSLANKNISFTAASRIYLPKSWAQDPQRRKKVGMPKDVRFQKKWEIALDLINELEKADLPKAPILADAGYGDATEFRDCLTGQKRPYVVGIKGGTTVWPPDKQPLPPAEYCGRGRPPKLLRRDKDHQPITVKSLAKSLPRDKWETIKWREGTKGKKSSRFTALRIRPAHGDTKRTKPRPIEWLLIEWPKKKKAPSKYWLSTLPAGTPLKELVRLAKLRWRIERDYQEMKQEFGLEDYEGRGWRGFHHHWTLSIITYAFFAAERARFSPLKPGALFQRSPVPEDFRPRGSPVPS